VRRSTTDLLLLMIAGTVCLVILFVGGAVFVLELRGSDTSKLAGNLTDVVNTLVGLLAGFLAGRTDRRRKAETLEAEE
jgi:hypothetical protein